MVNEKKPFHEAIAEKLIEQIKEGTAPWQKPWDGSNALPTNHLSGKRYKGINLLRLMAEGRSDNRWMTYKQASSVGAQVEKGQKGTSIQYWKFFDEKPKLDANNRPMRDADGQVVKELVKLERPKVFYATVFNAEQIAGLPEQESRSRTWDTVERAEKILNASGAEIQHVLSDRAFYSPGKDKIQLPEKSQFPTEKDYYGTALHELGHWTGHATRLDRDLSNPFGSEGYAKEELRAEISSMILGEELGVGNDTDRNAAYVKSWVKVLEEDPFEIIRAASDAEKISDYVLGLENQQEKEHAQLHEQEAGELSTFLGRVDHVKEINESEKEVRAARVNDERLTNDSGSVGAEVSVAKNRLQAAENVVDRERGIEQAGLTAPDATKPDDVLPGSISGSRTNIDVPFAEKQEAKELGARWDRQEKTWYVPPNVSLAAFSRWKVGARQKPAKVEETSQAITENRQYLAVPYAERVAAKSAGAKWDKSAKSWYADSGSDMDRLADWLPENVQHEQNPAMLPRDEFADALRSVGCIVEGAHPVMDGSKQRIAVEGDKAGETAGFYVGHLDGHPAGYIKNNRTGDEMRWKSKGYSLSDNEKAKLQAESAAKMAERKAAQEKLQEQCSRHVIEESAKMSQVSQPTAYLRDKGVGPKIGTLTDDAGEKTYIPAFDANGKQWTTQTISEDGTKRFARNGRKEGCFHPVGGLDAIATAPALLISEGYATAATISEAVGFATIAAFDSGNLLKVSEALHEKYPDKPVFIFGDDDRQLEMTQGINIGKVKAIEAAEAVGGKAVFPIFAPGEAGYPADLPEVTPERYKAHLQAMREIEKAPMSERDELKQMLLGDDQVSALARMKKYTDFNDLSSNSKLGIKGVERQVRSSAVKEIDDAALNREQVRQSSERSKKLEIGQRKRLSRAG